MVARRRRRKHQRKTRRRRRRPTARPRLLAQRRARSAKPTRTPRKTSQRLSADDLLGERLPSLKQKLSPRKRPSQKRRLSLNQRQMVRNQGVDQREARRLRRRKSPRHLLLVLESGRGVVGSRLSLFSQGRL